MLEVIFILIVLIGQGGAFISLLNRRLFNARKGWPRDLATAFSGVVLIGAPMFGLAVLHRRGVLSDLAHFRGPGAAAWLVAAYETVVLVAVARFLWVSLVTLPQRERPTIVVGESRSVRSLEAAQQNDEAGPGTGNRAAGPIARLNCRAELEVNEFVLSPPNLPRPFDGFSILHLSDIHATHSDPEGWHDFVADTVERLKADLIAITGDFLARLADLAYVERMLPRLRAPHGVWAIRGNHDFWEAPDQLHALLTRYHVTVLANQRTEIRLDGASFDLVGIESPWDYSGTAWRRHLHSTSDRMKIVLSHTPDHAPAVARRGATLMLAGHTHGGQIRFPWIGSLLVPSRYGKRFDQGWFAVGSLALYVNRGIGSYAPDLRLACRPEIARFVFRCPDRSGDGGQVGIGRS